MNFYFITGLPRSKTAWLANFLSYDNSLCFHDALAICDSIDQLALRLRNSSCFNVGHSDPANLLFEDRLRELFPAARWVVVDRPAQESIDSYAATFSVDLSERVRSLTVVKDRIKNALHVPFEAVESRAMEIAEFVAPGFRCPRARWDMLANFNVQLQRDYVASGISKHANNPLFKEAA